MAWTFHTWVDEHFDELWAKGITLPEGLKKEYYSRNINRVEDTNPLPGERRKNG